ncbi:hypothetical protein DL93DRAFT_1755396 [Clavulina sp. PMI_390]|nr:hypothetical protein DL93DRAFT_1755396 [Clavulina sp. PMI_390]
MISSEEEAQNAVCVTLRPLLDSIIPGYVDAPSTRHYNQTIHSEAHNLCSQLLGTMVGEEIGDPIRNIERAQQFGAFQSVLALLLEIAPFAGSLSPAELEVDAANGKHSGHCDFDIQRHTTFSSRRNKGPLSGVWT